MSQAPVFAVEKGFLQFIGRTHKSAQTLQKIGRIPKIGTSGLTTLALSDQPRVAGSASALLGVLQYAIGASAAPLVGAFGIRTALPMAVVIATLGISALLVFAFLVRGGEPLPAEPEYGK